MLLILLVILQVMPFIIDDDHNQWMSTVVGLRPVVLHAGVYNAVMNLMPISPLDGGEIAECWVQDNVVPCRRKLMLTVIQVIGTLFFLMTGIVDTHFIM